MKIKRNFLLPFLIIAVLAAAFYYGGNAPGAKGWDVNEDTPATDTTPDVQTAPAPDLTPAPAPVPEGNTAPEHTPTVSPEEAESPAAPPAPEQAQTPVPPSPPSATMEIDPETGKDKYLTDPIPEGKPIPVEPQDVRIGSTAYTCTLSISCATILDNMALCDAAKVDLVPADGWILPPVSVTFYEGESVFNVLQRVCKQQKIHMEFENTPIYNSAYIEGIHNLYEFDVGELSGWMYQVNGWFPNYGCSRYALKDGDRIEWVYTCDLGNDVGGGYAVGNK